MELKDYDRVSDAEWLEDAASDPEAERKFLCASWYGEELRQWSDVYEVWVVAVV